MSGATKDNCIIADLVEACFRLSIAGKDRQKTARSGLFRTSLMSIIEA